MLKNLLRLSVILLAACLVGAGIYALAGGSSPAASGPQGGFEPRLGDQRSFPAQGGFPQGEMEGMGRHGPGGGEQEASPLHGLGGIAGDLLVIGLITLVVLRVQKLCSRLSLRRAVRQAARL
jgi:hypothetical protein